jgi:hypothetical protein
MPKARISADIVSCAECIDAPEAARQRRQRRQVDVGGHRLQPSSSAIAVAARPRGTRGAAAVAPVDALAMLMQRG